MEKQTIRKRLDTLILLLIMTFVGISMLITGTVLDTITQSFSLSLSQAGLIIFAMSLGFATSSTLGGILSDIVGKKVTILTGLAFLSMFLILVGISNSFSFALIFIALMGTSWGFVQPPVNALLIDMYPQRSNHILNLSYLFFGAGAMLAPLIADYIVSNYTSWQFVYHGVAILSLLGFFLLLSIAVENPVVITKQPKQSDELRHITKIRGLLSTRTFVLLGLVVVLYMGSEVAVTSWLVVSLQRIHSFPLTWAARVLSLFQLMMIAGRLLCARISPRLKADHLALALTLGSTLFIVAAVVLRVSSLAALAWALSGIFFSGIMPALLTYGNLKFPQRAGTVIGLLTSFAGVGGIACPTLVGIAADWAGLRFAMGIPAISLFLALTILMYLVHAD